MNLRPPPTGTPRLPGNRSYTQIVLGRERSNRAARPRLLLVGYGRRGRQWHDACRNRRDVDVAGAVDPDPSALEAARGAGLTTWPTLADALEAAGCQAAIVASPPHDHPDHAIGCLRAGVVVLVEKPFALSLEAAGRIAQASAALGIPVTVGQNFRFLRRERAVRKASESGVGRLLGASIVSARSAAVAMPHLASVPHGPLWDIGIHHLDAVRVRLGSAPERVSMTVTRLGGERQRFDVRLDWSDGPSVVYQHSEGAPGYYHSEWIEGEHRAILVDDQDVSLLFPSQRPRRVRVPRGPEPEQAVLDQFLESLGTGDSGALGADDNMFTVAMLDAAVRSEQLGRPVTLGEADEASAVAHG
jgi:predicted dehydrogenase